MTAPTLHAAMEMTLSHTTILALHTTVPSTPAKPRTFHCPKGIFGFRDVAAFDLKPLGRPGFEPLHVLHASDNPYICLGLYQITH